MQCHQVMKTKMCVISTISSDPTESHLRPREPTVHHVQDAENEALNHLNCGICLSLCDRPVTASCQHNFCLKCFKKWVNQEKTQCPTCRATFSKSLIQNPRINTMLSFRMRQKKHVRHYPPCWVKCSDAYTACCKSMETSFTYTCDL